MPHMDDGRNLGVQIGEQEIAECRATDPDFTYAETAGRDRAAELLQPTRRRLPPTTAAVAFQFILDRLTTRPRR
jgi:hypothetical protein